MRIGRLMFVLPVVVLSVGCFQGQRTFKVNADGSGTIVDTTKLGEQAKGMLAGMEEMDKSSPAEKKAKKKAKYVEKAAAMGEGVTFVSAETAKDGSDVTIYAFKDITKVKVSGMPSPDQGSSTSKEEPLTFKLTKNAAGNTVLTVVSPPEKAADPKAPKPEAKPKKKPEEIQQEITMMKGMMAGLKIKSTVEVNGKLVKTNSPNVVGPVVTLMEMDFDALDMAALQKLSEGGQGGGPPTPAMMKGIKGIKVSDPEVTIEFTGGK
jgi:hypothetical protein